MSQTSIAAWNQYCLEFLHKLTETFPECPELFVAINAAEALIEEDEMRVLNDFVEEIEPYSEELATKNDEFFLDSDIDFLKRLDIVQFWTPELEDVTKDTIWQYLQTMLVMAKTIQKVPPHLLRLIERYASKVQAETPDGQFDPANVDMTTLGMGALRHMEEEDPEAFKSIFGKSGAAPTTTCNPVLQETRAPFTFPAAQPRPAPAAAAPQHFGWGKLQEMLKAPQQQPLSSVPGLGATFQNFQQREQIQRTGPIPPPASALNNRNNYSVGATRK